MDKWSSLPAWGWMIVALLFGYAIGLIHGFYQHWFKGKVYCPRCLYYLNWRDTIFREVIPKWMTKEHAKDAWERDSPESHSQASD
jgi:hypothetical protein